ncbi:MAG: hypothetical protein A3B11_00045 [Candidatus Taylorbacteria bacterium RIFCSPLOWO2_01_FULL_44_26]|uniref:GIY-YIG domain-containing protein n=2 Tax=Candidatus Tayloriibacteriota TaxID=1817919 RepID=A0A1G2ML19_9BACT|nr:MAG: hypothetical protein A3D50_01685 [Candidatus Taylorbacteria bacterium RIFCSPHIGHO2_02_FULL_44_12]OHA31084.1 MAG: hypothetical protein A3B11_00045 [Candidatus Taylorbacteria bacterium RIFCSPLOWO2_01_FULL_44_26]
MKKDGSFYVGSSENLRSRIANHKSGSVITTSSRLPIALVWYCCFIDKRNALRFEKYLKHGSGFAFTRRRLV